MQNTFALLAQAGPDAESVKEAAQLWLDFWKYAGTAAAILAFIAGFFLLHYWKVLLPREQAKTEDQRTESHARTESHKQTGSAMQTIAACIERYDIRFDNLDRAVGGLHDRIERFCNRRHDDPGEPPNNRRS